MIVIHLTRLHIAALSTELALIARPNYLLYAIVSLCCANQFVKSVSRGASILLTIIRISVGRQIKILKEIPTAIRSIVIMVKESL